MSTYEERLASFTDWPNSPYISPTPEDLAYAGFSHQPTSKDPDTVICQACRTSLYDWEPDDDPMQEHYLRSKSCIRFPSKSSPTMMMFAQDVTALLQKRSQASLLKDQKGSSRQASAQGAPLQASSPKALQPSPKDIGFLDPSLQHDFPELCLFHDSNAFCDHLERCRSGFGDADILALLPKCLRGEALMWFNQAKYQDLAVCLQALKTRFSQVSQAAPQEAPHAINQSACHASEYHHCKLCNASFSSMARLIRHTQENICDKPSCSHCEKVFPSRNQLHIHLREECQKQLHRRSSHPPTPLPAYSSPLPTPRILSPPPEENRALLPPSPPPTYRILSPPPPTYKLVKNFLTVEDLYARYAPKYLKVDDLFRMFGRRSARSSTVPTTPIAPRPISMRHRGRRLAEKGDRSTKTPQTTKTTTKPKPKPKPKNSPFVGTPLQPIPYKSVPPLQRSRSTSCPMATCPTAPRPTATPHCLPPPCELRPKAHNTTKHQILDAHHSHASCHRCPISSMLAPEQHTHTSQSTRRSF
ncbi:hypothetical protein ABVK25_000036 [Lepraria finkii]|uniref:C2H2-type domain-containing protein n=1 Tax=Lepraria finkii TaxID=1340010 RepID=A0ABR4BLT3_9LECA